MKINSSRRTWPRNVFTCVTQCSWQDQSVCRVVGHRNISNKDDDTCTAMKKKKKEREESAFHHYFISEN